MNLLTAGPDTDSFISLYEADDYHSNRLHKSDWSGASNADKKSALIWATNLIIQQVRFSSSPLNQNQKLPAPFYNSILDLYSDDVTGTWTQSSVDSSLYYLDSNPTFDKLSLDGIELAKGYVEASNYLEIGEYGSGDIDSIGNDALYFRIFDKVPNKYTFKACYFYTDTGRIETSINFIDDAIKYATAEYALVLIKSDVTAPSGTTGVKSMKLGAMAFAFNNYDSIPKMPSQVSDYLKNYGQVISGSNIEIGRG